MKRKLTFFPVFLLLLSVFTISCVTPEKKVTYNIEDYRKLAMKRVVKDKFLLNISYVTNKGDGEKVDTFFHDVYSPPYKLDDDVIKEVRNCLNLVKEPRERFEKLRECLISTPDTIEYEPGYTLDASNCYRLRKGNCFALTNLLIGAARYAGYDARYMLVEDIISNNETESSIIHTNHIVCQANIAGRKVIADFIPNPRQYRVTTVITDMEAAGLFYNNLASKFLVAGDYRNAAIIFEIALAFFPNSYQVNNNIGALLLKTNQPERARAYFYRALENTKFPDLIYGNMVSMMKKTGRDSEIKELEASLDNVRKRNPYFYIALARKAFENEEWDKSLKHLKTAQRLNKSIPQIYALKVKIYENLNDFNKKNKATEKMKKYRELREYD